MSEAAELAGFRILVAEDEVLVAMMIEDMLSDLGCVVLGPAGSVAEALALVEGPQATPEGALRSPAGTPDTPTSGQSKK